MVGMGDRRQYRKLDSKNDKVFVGGQTHSMNASPNEALCTITEILTFSFQKREANLPTKQ